MHQPPTIPPAIAALHRRYLALTNQSERDLPLTWPRLDAWRNWTAMELTVADLEELISEIRRKQAAGEVCRGLTFRSLVGQPDYAQEDLALARARRRGRKAPAEVARDQVMRESGRPTDFGGGPTRDTPETVSAALRHLREQIAGIAPAVRKRS